MHLSRQASRIATTKYLKTVLPLGIVVMLATVGLVGQREAEAAGPEAVGLGTAGAFAILGRSTVTNTGPTVINGDLGLSPGTAITGFPPGTVNGVVHNTNEVALQAQTDLTTAYNDAAGRAGTIIPSELGGQTLVAGVYKGAPSLDLTGTVTLDGQGDPNAVFIFQAPDSTLTTASDSRVLLTGGAQACNVIWQVGSSATLGTNSSFAGTILAFTAVTVTTGAEVVGSVLARNAAVTLDNNTISRALCAAAPVTTTTVPGGVTTTTITDGGTATTVPGATATTVPGGGTTTTTARRTTATTTPGGGTPTDSVGGPPRTGGPPLARTGPNHVQGQAWAGLALMGLGLAMMRTTRRRAAG